MAIDNLQPLCHVVINILFALGEGSIFLRIWTKAHVLQQFGPDDWMMTATAFFNAGQHAILYVFMKYGAGRHQVEVLAEDPQSLTKLLKSLFAEEIWYIWLHFSIKMCFLLFYFRLSNQKGFRKAVYAAIGYNVAVTISIWLIYCLQCIPIETFWYPERHPDVTCIAPKVSYFLPASMLISVDVVILLLPLHTIWNLQMSLRRRLQVLGVITLGGSSVLVSGLRLIVLNNFSTDPDFTYQLGNIVLTSAAEMDVAILAANMPAVRALWTSWRKGTLSSNGSKPYGSNMYTPSGQSKGHQLSTLFSKRERKGERLDDVSDEFTTVERDGSTRRLTKHGSDEELGGKGELSSRASKTQIKVTKEYTIRKEASIEDPQREQQAAAAPRFF